VLVKHPLTEDQARQIAEGDLRSLPSGNVEWLGPLCYSCETEWAEAPKSCPGEARAPAAAGPPPRPL